MAEVRAAPQPGWRAHGPGTATLPVADLFRQIIDEVRPKVIITVGTAGATFGDHQLGDVVITRGAKYRLTQEFANERFARSCSGAGSAPKKHLGTAVGLMDVSREHLVEPDFGPLRPPTPSKDR